MPIRRYRRNVGVIQAELVRALPTGSTPIPSVPSPVPYVDISFIATGSASDDLDEIMTFLGYEFVIESPTTALSAAASAGAPPTSSFLLPDNTVLPLNLISDGQFLQRSGGNIVGTSSTVSVHGLAGGLHSASPLASLNALVSDATLDDVSGARTPTVHALAGGTHSSSTLASLNALVSDATLDDTNDPRTPTGAASGQLGGTYPSPDVRGIRETGGPTLLTFGAIVDGQALVRSAGTVVGASLVPATRTLTAGTGLTGGGDLSANRTFNVGAHADGSIVVNADDVQVGVLATDAQHGARGGGTQHALVVAGGNAGFMSGADKTKLDGIAAPISVTATGTTSTGSSTYGTIATMTSTPPAGTYLVTFSASGNVSIGSSTGEYAIHVAGTIVQHSERNQNVSGGSQVGGVDMAMHTQATVTVNGSQAVTVQYRVSSGTYTVHERSMILRRVS